MSSIDAPDASGTPAEKLPSVGDAISARLRLRDDLVFQPEINGEMPGYTIEDPMRGKYFRVGLREYGFIALLDGRSTIAEAVAICAKTLRSSALAEYEALAVCRWLLENQLAQPSGGNHEKQLRQAAEQQDRRKLSALNPLSMQLPLVAPDRTLGFIAEHLRWLMSLPAAAVWLCFTAYAGYLLCISSTSFSETTSVILAQENWIWLAAAWIGLKVLHETAHGIACKIFGGSVPSAGVALIFFAPLAYVDVTSSWRFRSKWSRIATAAAGMVAELFVASLAVIVASQTAPGWTHSMAINVAFTAGVATVLFNANPLVRFDGYYIISDLLELPNLSSRGQHLLSASLQWCLTGGRWQPTGLGRKAWLVGMYAIAAIVWRAVFFISIAAALVAWFAECGVALAVLMLTIAWIVPAAQAAYRFAQALRQTEVRRKRVAAVAGVMALSTVIIALLLCRPGRLSAPAVVEYAPLTVVRTDAPGFVEEVCVSNGQHVAEGDIIALLRNEDLRTDLADMELQAAQSIVMQRLHERNDEWTKGQIESARRESLAKKIAELRRRTDSLTVRAPSAGTVVAKDLDTLRGKYLPTGSEVVVLGSEDQKEMIIAVPQDDVELFHGQLDCHGEISVRTSSGRVFAARLTKVEPKASTELPHPAFATTTGGPLAVKPKSVPDDAGDKHRETIELLSPTFIARADLVQPPGVVVLAGQRATVKFTTATETTAERLWKAAEGWFARRSSTKGRS
jgi:putative peptide zinc metalloprotease protein